MIRLPTSMSRSTRSAASDSPPFEGVGQDRDLFWRGSFLWPEHASDSVGTTKDIVWVDREQDFGLRQSLMHSRNVNGFHRCQARTARVHRVAALTQDHRSNESPVSPR